MAYRDIPEEEYRQWAAIYEQAASTINGRGEALDQAADLIEKDLFLLGATAIEDKLQDGVPDTIHTLQMAGIKVELCQQSRKVFCSLNLGVGFNRGPTRDGNQHWHVLSPDFGIDEFGTSVTTALESLLSRCHSQVIVNEENAHDTGEFLNKRLHAIKNQRSSGELEDLALIIGQTSFVLADRFLPCVRSRR